MKIGIDISQTAFHGTGVARFTEGLIQCISSDKYNEWTLFFSSLRQKPDQRLLQHTIKLKQYRLPPSLLSFLWNKIHILDMKNFVGPQDWFITSDWTEPPFKSARKATIVHDLTFRRFPEVVDPMIRDTQEKRLQRVAKESDIIFVDSQSTATDLSHYYTIPCKRIAVNYPGVEIVNPTESDIVTTKLKYALHKSFILAVGKIEPRKNLKRLVEAYKKLNQTDVELVIAGPPGWDKLDANQVENVRFLGYVSDSELSSLYRLCMFFMYPSLYEGFGYPPLEAMLHGCPVTMSNTSSLGEIGGDACLYFNPESIEEMSDSINKMIKDESLRKTLSSKGLIHAKKYSWDRYYHTMIDKLTSFK
ncbi:glycosyltransferase family 4 protein [Candidatus Roizmanbacteria bacterium]|nr:glycosyltransferase family 4 protein [Candidatus Roizmanbacteria bacterium]